MSTKLYVGNLSYSTMEHQLREAFAPYGEVVSATLVVDRMSGQSRGFGFVEFSTPADAQRAIDAMSGAELDGRALNVSVARPRGEGGGGGGGGGGRDRRPNGGDRGGRGGRGGGGGGGGGRW
jgi:RNA recognition motif-containing protein